jgi:hypothetical protein
MCGKKVENVATTTKRATSKAKITPNNENAFIHKATPELIESMKFVIDK